MRGASEVRSPFGADARGGVRPAGAEQAAVLHLGSEALRLARRSQTESGPTAIADEAEPAPGEAGAGEPAAAEEHSEEIQELQRRDREVRTHEQAHKAAGGAYAGSINLGFTVGPDGKRYASSGSVSIDVSPVKGDPEATLRKMQIVQRAATAPADPSGADRQVAARAASTATQARAELAAKRYAEAQQLRPA